MTMVRASARRSVRPSIRPSTKPPGFVNPLLSNLVLHAPLTQSVSALVGTSPTLTRSTKKWVYVPETGLLTEVAINAGGFEAGGLSIEPTATNTALGDIAQWAASNDGAVDQDGTLGPDGATQAIRFTVGQPNSLAYTLMAGTELSTGCWVRAGTSTDVSVAVIDAGLAILGVETVTCTGDEWQFVRVDFTGTPFALVVATGNGAGQIEGDTCYFCFPQAHDTDHVGTTIITTDASVQRTQDKLTILNANMPDPHVAHTIAFDLIVHHTPTTAYLFEGIAETPKRALMVWSDGTLEATYGVGAVTSAVGAIAEGAGYRVVITCSGTSFSMYINGELIGTDPTGPGSTGGNIVFGEAGGSYFTISNLKIYDAEATAAQVPYV